MDAVHKSTLLEDHPDVVVRHGLLEVGNLRLQLGNLLRIPMSAKIRFSRWRCVSMGWNVIGNQENSRLCQGRCQLPTEPWEYNALLRKRNTSALHVGAGVILLIALLIHTRAHAHQYSTLFRRRQGGQADSKRREFRNACGPPAVALTPTHSSTHFELGDPLLVPRVASQWKTRFPVCGFQPERWLVLLVQAVHREVEQHIVS